LIRDQLRVGQALERLTQPAPDSNLRRITQQEACAALLTACWLGWLKL
jgi:hypothetical protein